MFNKYLISNANTEFCTSNSKDPFDLRLVDISHKYVAINTRGEIHSYSNKSQIPKRINDYSKETMLHDFGHFHNYNADIILKRIGDSKSFRLLKVPKDCENIFIVFFDDLISHLTKSESDPKILISIGNDISTVTYTDSLSGHRFFISMLHEDKKCNCYVYVPEKLSISDNIRYELGNSFLSDIFRHSTKRIK